MTAMFDCKYPTETRVITLNAAADLATGETLTAIATTTITAVRGSDPSMTLTATQASINASQFTIATSQGQSVTVPAESAVQAVVSGGLDGVWYQVEFLCATTNPNKTVSLSGIVPVSVSC